MIELRLPNLTATNERELLIQIKSYLYQHVEQLQWALGNLEASSSNAVVIAPNNIAPQKVATVDTQTTFAAIKPLIIKSAEIVNAYYESVKSRLEGLYVAQSDFGEFKELTIAETTETSKAVETNYKNIQQIATDIQNINFTLAEVNAHIKSGFLYYDENEIPVYGLEIGQMNSIDGEEVFNKYARFTADRLSFYDQNDTEVAYISDYKLHITNVEITGEAKLGAYLLDTSNGIAFKWVGRG